ncbi:hypothetical protein ACFPOU_08080 [Massilia jejuensis]|uniref:Uncharacterized protein n=1 Tax=Massilia jejuensis TaxID=648894 RepID=A0ABW0PFI0_9BURK
MTSEYIRPLIASFPWLTESEASGVAAALPSPDPAAPAADHMSRLAAALDTAGLLATSTLLLALSHGSKGTAVAVARRAARSRFERAGAAAALPSDADHGRTPSPAPGPMPAPRDPYIGEEQLRRCVQATVEDVLAKLPGAFGASDSDRIVPLLEGLAGEVRWLKSTIDTERQLRRYREAHGPLPEHQAPQGPASAADRRSVVAGLASSLEQQRFTSHVAPSIDMADGREE